MGVRRPWLAPSLNQRSLRAGRSFRYLDADGKTVPPDVRDRIAGLVIPPAWKEVWICPWPNGHIQAVGFDAAGRRQYLYHPYWRVQRDREKFDHVLTVAERLPDVHPFQPPGRRR